MRWSRTVVALLALGAIARLASLAVQAQQDLQPDGLLALDLAREFSLASPWGASLREPLWIAMVKITTGPFGYTPGALRIVTTALSIAAPPLVWIVLRSRLDRRVAVIAIGIVSLHGLLVLSAPRGLREELVLVLVVAGFAAALRPRPSIAGAACAVGGLAVVRWEVALLALGLLVVGAALQRVRWHVPVAAALAIVVVAGPWLLANDHEYGDPLIHSNQHASFWHEVYLDDTDPGHAVRIRSSTWLRFYGEELGPVTSAWRIAVGGIGLAVDFVADGIQPLSDRWIERSTSREPLRAAGRLANAVLPWAAGAVWLAALVGLRRRHLGVPQVVSLAVAVAAWASYGALRSLSFFDGRFVVFSIPFAAVLLAEGAVGLLTGTSAGEAAPSTMVAARPSPLQHGGDTVGGE